MNFLKIAHVTLFLLFPQLAWSTLVDRTPAKAMNCRRCADIKDLENRFLALNYEKEVDRKQGFEMIPKVLEQLQSFHNHQRDFDAPKKFGMLVRLVSAALPYEQGPESTESLASLILYPDTSTSWKLIYEEVAESITEACRQKLLRRAVEERICNMRMEERNQGGRRNPFACIKSPVFRYDHCIGMKTED